MSCVACQKRIEKKLSETDGISRVSVSYEKGRAEISYDEEKIKIEKIFEIIDGMGYSARVSQNKFFWLISFIAIIFIFFLIKHLGIDNIFNNFSVVDSSITYGMLFLIGITTSVHCVAMCGGINISQCLSKEKTVLPSLLYNAGRVISYTSIGAVVGAIGSIIQLSDNFRAAFMLAAGFFMIIAGINIGGGFSWTRKFNFHLPEIFKNNSKSPLIVGFLNGFMPCGPLQSMQFYALSSGSAVNGAVSMFLFSAGTLPLMFILGAASSVLSRKFREIAIKTGAVLVVLLGIIMISNGLNSHGISLNLGKSGVSMNENYTIENGVQIVRTRLQSGNYPSIIIKENMPVKWIIDAGKRDINGCNNRIFIHNKYGFDFKVSENILPERTGRDGIEYSFSIGENIIEFTPTSRGKFVYTCWMDMISSTITVVKNDEK